MKKPQLKTVLTVLILTSVLSLLFVKSNSHDIQKHHNVITNIQQLSYHDSLFNEAILDLKANQFANYDTLTRQTQAIERILKWLVSSESGIYNTHGQDLDQTINQATDAFFQKKSLMERFQSHNGILKNSLYYFPTVVQNFKLDSNNTSTDELVDRLFKEILLFHVRSDEKNATQAAATIKILENTDKASVSDVIKHAETIIHRKQALDKSAKELFTQPTRKSVEAIYTTYSQYNADIIKSTRGYRIAMYAFALLLLGYIFKLFLTLRSTMTKLEKSLNELEFQKHALDEHAIVISITPDGLIEYANERFQKTSQFNENELKDHVRNLIDYRFHPWSFTSNIRNILKTGKTWRGEIRCVTKDQNFYWADTTIVPFVDKAGNPSRYVALLTDITEKKAVDERIFRLAHYDALTQLTNRPYFLEKTENALIQSKNNSAKMAVVFLDLDNFKIINDTLGHAFGDTLLMFVGDHLRECVRETDVISRMGGDEFTIALPSIASNNEIEQIVESILSITNKCVRIENRDITISTSIGVSVYPEDGESVDSLLKNADMAMYQAKTEGKNKYVFYNEDLKTENLIRHKLDNDLKEAVRENQFELYYQPQICTDSKKICAVEALLRWNHPERGLIAPDAFIPSLEENGLIVEVGDWVLTQACTQLAAWKKIGFDLKISVNISPRQIRNDHLLEVLKNILNFRAIQPADLQLELTESGLLDNTELTSSLLEKVNDLGVAIALDDFGTGYSSLSYLKKLPINTLKIDRSFVRDLPDDQHDLEIVATILAMAKNLGLATVAEGVETMEQRDFLAENGCDYLQGYMFSKPRNAEDMLKMLHDDNSNPDISSVTNIAS